MKNNQIILLNYTHCPYCVRVRMALGHLSIPYISQVVSYDDEKTPTQLIGKKMLPIVVDNGVPQCESLDIIAKYDVKDVLKLKSFNKEEIEQLERELSSFGELIHSLCMPHWIFTPEFNSNARIYFQKKKEIKRGPFRELIKKREQLQLELENKLLNFENKIDSFYNSTEFSIKDIIVAAHFWGLYILPEFQFSPKFHSYLQKIKHLTNFTYWDHFDQYL